MVLFVVKVAQRKRATAECCENDLFLQQLITSDLCEGYDESTLALLTAAEAQIPVCGVDRARRVAAGVRSPNRA